MPSPDRPPPRTRGGSAAERPALSDAGTSRVVWLVAILCVLAIVAGGAWYARDRVSLFFGDSCRATALDESVTFDPEQMNHASTIVQIGVRRGLPARAGSIAVATAIQESKLRNITYGDRDSVGLFQQRPSQGWGTEEEILDPIFATNAFYDALVKVDGWQDMRITEIAQEVQRSAYPEAYADHEHEGRTLASVIAGHSPGGLGCSLDDADAPGRPDTLVSALREQTGHTGREDSTDSEVRVVVDASGEERAWGVGAWAVAQAQARQITAVQVGEREWRRGGGRDALEWRDAAEPVAATRVVITLNS